MRRAGQSPGRPLQRLAARRPVKGNKIMEEYSHAPISIRIAGEQAVGRTAAGGRDRESGHDTQPPSLPDGEAPSGAFTETSERRRGEWVGTLSGAIASALWYQSTLRHGLFTPTDFARLCEPVIRRVLDEVGVANELPAKKPSPQGDSPTGSAPDQRPAE